MNAPANIKPRIAGRAADPLRHVVSRFKANFGTGDAAEKRKIAWLFWVFVHDPEFLNAGFSARSPLNSKVDEPHAYSKAFAALKNLVARDNRVRWIADVTNVPPEAKQVLDGHILKGWSSEKVALEISSNPAREKPGKLEVERVRASLVNSLDWLYLKIDGSFFSGSSGT